VGKRLGLLIGNSVYRDSTLARLAAPDVDVGDLADVLLDREVGGFDDVKVIVNVSAAIARRAISDFFSAKGREDLLLLYFSCHGVLDENGRLYFAFKDTEHQLLRATSISAAYINDEMNASRSQRQVLILDCCHSGAFARGSKGAAGASVGTASAFEGTGYGRVVLTATDATQYAWEGDQVSGEALNSLFTHYLVEGLQSGEADANKDGRITVDELYDYIYARVVKQTPKQTPGKWSYREQGEIVIASSPVQLTGKEPGEASVEFDDELQQRLSRWYTRGLSAFWLEEWDKAEEAFQTITEIQPDYQDTAVKLMEVKRQKKLSDLYRQAVAAGAKKDWDSVILALQTLTEETSGYPEAKGYKDADARLAEARKQKNLADFYSQAQQLCQAKQWQAVVNIFARIAAIESDYPDPSDLFAQAKRELEAEKRRKELQDHYDQALRAMEAAQWQSARDHLLAVQAADPAYGDTEGLLRRVEVELAQERPAAMTQTEGALATEGQGSQDALRVEASQPAATPKGIGNPWARIRNLNISWNISNLVKPPAPAATAVYAPFPDRNLWYILMVSLSWFLASLIQFWQGQSLIDNGQADTVWLIRFFVFGVLAGLFFWLILRQIEPALDWKRGLIIIAGWTLAALLVKFLGTDSPGVAEVVLLYAFAGFVSGLATSWALRLAAPDMTIKKLGWIAVGCALGFGIGGAMVAISAPSLVDKYGDPPGVAWSLSLGSGIAGLLVASIVIRVLANTGRQAVRWSTVLLGTAGFLLGDLVANLISPSVYLYDDSIYLYLASIGAIGFAFLSLPSRKPGRIIFFAALGLIGLLLGHWLGIQLFGDYDILVMICWGAGLGLALGLSTGSLPGVLIMVLLGLAATAITSGLVVLQSGHDLSALSYLLITTVAGAVLALGWSFLGGDITAARAGQ
jgi:hypothetical protein